MGYTSSLKAISMENGGKAWTEQLDDPVTSGVEGPF